MVTLSRGSGVGNRLNFGVGDSDGSGDGVENWKLALLLIVGLIVFWILSFVLIWAIANGEEKSGQKSLEQMQVEQALQIIKAKGEYIE